MLVRWKCLQKWCKNPRLLQLSLASKARPGAITKCENEYYETGGKKAGNL